MRTDLHGSLPFYQRDPHVGHEGSVEFSGGIINGAIGLFGWVRDIWDCATVQQEYFKFSTTYWSISQWRIGASWRWLRAICRTLVFLVIIKPSPSSWVATSSSLVDGASRYRLSVWRLSHWAIYCVYLPWDAGIWTYYGERTCHQSRWWDAETAEKAAFWAQSGELSHWSSISASSL